MPQVAPFYTTKVFIKFCKILRKTSVPESLFNLVAGLRSATLLKVDSDTEVFFPRTSPIAAFTHFVPILAFILIFIILCRIAGDTRKH